MHTDVSEAGPFERLVTVSLEEAELEDAKNAAARKISKQLKIKGFRPGKAPRSIVERHVGADSLRAEAIDDSLGELVGGALEDIDLEPVVTPSVTDIRDREGDEGGVEIDVKITLWPTLSDVPDYARSIEIEAPEVDQEEIDEQIDRVRSQYAELEDVDRAADSGDFVLVDLSAKLDGVPVDEVAATDLLYELGSASYIAGLDDLLAGASAGDIKEGPATLPDGFGDHGGEEVSLTALVKGVQARKLPELNDEWVSDVSDFDTVDELTDRMRTSLLGMKISTAAGQFRDSVLDDILTDVDLEVPEALVESELESSVHNLSHSLQQQGLDLNTYLSVTGQDQEAFVAELRTGAVRSLRTRILLEAIAAAEDIEVEDDEITAALSEMSGDSGRSVEELRSLVEANGQLNVLTGDILRRKALDRVIEASTAVDSDGNPVDLTVPEDDLDEDDDDDLDDETDGVVAEEGSSEPDDEADAEEDSDEEAADDDE